MELQFRNVDSADLGVVLAFMRDLYAFDRIPFDEPRSKLALEGLLADSSFGRVWLILDGGEAIGYVVLTLGYSLEYGGRDAYIDELFVRAGDRRRGVGSKALQFVEAECRALGIRALHLQVVRDNTNAQSVYRRAGFCVADRFLMTKWIGQ